MNTDQIYSPDPIWESFGILSQQDFLNKLVVKGKFHTDVPEDVKSAYERVERMLAYSYFFYPLIDEAYSKALLIFEMGIRIKAKAMGIIQEDKFYNLGNVLKELDKNSDPDLLPEWENAKRIRNYFVHPNRNSLFGASIIQGFYQIINIINKLFLSQEQLDQIKSDLKGINAKAKHFSEGVFIFDVNKRYLIHSAVPFAYKKLPDRTISFWTFFPVLNKMPDGLENYKYTPPINAKIENVVISSDRIFGRDIVTGEEILCVKSDSDEHFQIVNNYLNRIKALPEEVVKVNASFQYQEITKELQKFRYDEYWS